MCMTENQIQNAASDDPGGWSPEVQFLAREVVRLREDALEVVRLTDGHECGQRLRDRAEKAESNADDLRRALKNTTRDLSEALDRAEKAEAEVERLRRKISQVETDCDRVSQKLNVEKARSANIMRRAEQAEAELTKWESMEWKINEDADQLHDRVVRAEAEIKRLRAAMADTIKMDETPSKDQQIRKLDEEADLLLERACDAKNKLHLAKEVGL